MQARSRTAAPDLASVAGGRRGPGGCFRFGCRLVGCAATLGAVVGDLGVGVLGPLRVVRAGEPVELGSRRERAVLVRLALEAGSAVSVERLIEELWGGAAAAGGRGSLQSYVSRLRRVLDPERRGLIELAGGGYRLVVEADVVDALRFERLVGEASRALAANDFERASGLFAEALSLWRGGALADFAYEEWSAPVSVDT